MSWVAFDLARSAARHVHEDLSEHLHKAEPGSITGLPDKTEIHKEGNQTFHIHNRAGKRLSTHDGAEEAATAVLDHEAQSTHRDSLGGGTSYNSFAHYRRERGV